jgi:glutamine synthetase
MPATLTVDALKKLIKSGEIDTVLICMADMQGRLMGKRYTGHFFLESGIEAAHTCDYLLAIDMEIEPVPGYKASSWARGYGDFTLKPDLKTLRRVPWLPGTAMVLCDVVDHHGRDVPHSPRQILKKQAARAKAMGFKVMMAAELELFVFDESYEALRAKDYKNMKHAGWYIEDYVILQTTKEEPLIRAIRNHMDAVGVPVECSKGEWGPGQEEINLKYAEAVEMADRIAIYKNGAKEIAHQQGKAVSFMAKIDHSLAGNSFHLHSSLWDAKSGKPMFYDKAAADHMSPLFRHYLAGQLAGLREAAYFFAPYVNSYKRFSAGTFAPTKAVWSFDNRTAGFRILGDGPNSMRSECRVPGADANPYLAFAAALACGLYGIENKLKLEPAFEGNAYEGKNIREVPKSLRDALALLDKSKILRGAFGDDVVDHYIHAGEWEQQEFDRRVTDYERVRMFERG